MKQASCLASGKIGQLMEEKKQVIASFYTEEELLQIGFKSIGNGVKISRKTSIYSPNKISIGSNVRIDDFCILSGNITLGSYIHISANVLLYGSMGIDLEDYTGISSMTTVYSAMDDFSGDYLIGPIHPAELTNVTGGRVILKKYSQIGTHCVVFPKITIGEGAVVGACSLVNRSLDSWGVYYGIPAVLKKYRKKNLLNLI